MEQYNFLDFIKTASLTYIKYLIPIAIFRFLFVFILKAQFFLEFDVAIFFFVYLYFIPKSSFSLSKKFKELRFSLLFLGIFVFNTIALFIYNILPNDNIGLFETITYSTELNAENLLLYFMVAMVLAILYTIITIIYFVLSKLVSNFNFSKT